MWKSSLGLSLETEGPSLQASADQLLTTNYDEIKQIEQDIDFLDSLNCLLVNAENTLFKIQVIFKVYFHY